MNKSAQYWIDKLNLLPHPEGGYFREIYRSPEMINRDALPERYQGSRSFSTSIYFLIKYDNNSAFHRILSDEIWHFYTGSPLTLYVIDQQGELNVLKLGPDPDQNQDFQAIVKKNTWFGASVDEKNEYTLVGCTIAPGFEFNDFELASPNELEKKFPQHSEVIRKLS